MPRSQGTSRKGKPGKLDRASGFGKALQRAHGSGGTTAIKQYAPHGKAVKPSACGGGMAMQPGVESIGILDKNKEHGENTRSVLALKDIDDFLQQAELANREFTSEKEGLVVLDATGHAYRGPSSVQWSDLHGGESSANANNFTFTELSVPRRPKWDETTTPQELERNEHDSFLEWRRGIAAKEEQLLRASTSTTSGTTPTSPSCSTTVTPFEKNLNVWRQLWRVLERSDVVLQLVDARNPLFYLSKDLQDYATSAQVGYNKPMMVLVNKSDYLSRKQRQAWYDYLTINEGWQHVVFFSAALEQEKLDAAAQQQRRAESFVGQRGPENDEVLVDQENDNESEDDDDDDEEEDVHEDGAPDKNNVKPSETEEHPTSTTTDDSTTTTTTTNTALLTGVDSPLTRQQLMDAMMAFARQHNCQPHAKYDNRVQFGMVGFPNVGKSSVINVLVGSSKHTHGLARVGVASQPGKTKHFQTLLLPDKDDMMLCDCPGLVFPSFVSNTADLIAAGVYPIAQMRDHWPVITLICQRIPREIINAQYGIQIPTPTIDAMQQQQGHHFPLHQQVPPPTAEEFLTTYCIARGMLAAASGVPDFPRAARIVIRDYAAGKLLYCHAPPNIKNNINYNNAQEGGSLLSEKEFYRETIATALMQTKKLRDKILSSAHKKGTTYVDDDDVAHDDAQQEGHVDDDLLELVGGSLPSASSSSAGNNGNKKHHKWGKKDRKNRNKDPYGCHSTKPDDMLQNGAALSGVSVASGNKKHSHKAAGYTRPTSYSSVRFAPLGT